MAFDKQKWIDQTSPAFRPNNSRMLTRL